MPEPVDLVNAKDKVIGKTTKEEAHAKGSLHRAVHVFVFNKEGMLFLQKRSKKKLLAPGVWDSSVGEHVKAGESYKKAALRGLIEELRIKTSNIKLDCKIFRNDKTKTYHNREFITLFETECNSKIKPCKESEKTGWFSIKQLKKQVRKNPEKFCKAFLIFFRKYLKLRKT